MVLGCTALPLDGESAMRSMDSPSQKRRHDPSHAGDLPLTSHAVLLPTPQTSL